MSDLGSRFATAADVRAFYGTLPAPTIQAVVVLLDGEPAGLVGLAHRGGEMWLFSDFHDRLRPHLSRLTVLRAIKQVQQWVRASRLPVFAHSDPDEPESPKIIQRLGFTFYRRDADGDVYACRHC